MSKAKLKILGNPILLITLCCMIASTLISFFLVSKNNYNIDMLELKINDQKTLIREVAYTVNQKRIQVDAVILLSALANQNNKDVTRLKEKYLQIFPHLTVSSSGVEILEAFETYRNVKFNEINDVYIEKTILEQEKFSLGRKNKIYASIATLLQIIGLAFIIIRKDFSVDNLY